MGLFCLPKGNKSGDLVECAIGDLQLFMEDWQHKHEIHCSQKYPNGYLLVGAINILKEALDRYREECDVNPNVNPPLPPDPLVDIDLALESAKGNETNDCSMILHFLHQHHDQTNEFLGRLDPTIHSKLGVTAALRYTWQQQDKYSNWKKLINNVWKYYKNDGREELLYGLTQFVDL